MDKLKSKIIKRIEELLSVLELNDNKFSRTVFEKIDLNLKLLSLCLELKNFEFSDISAIGFNYEFEKYDED